MFISKRAIVFTFAAIMAIGSAGASEANGQNVLREILDRMDKHYKALQTLESNVSRSMFNSQLKESDNYAGNVVFVPGKGRDVSMLLKWTRPRTETLLIFKGRYRLYIPDIKTAYEGTTSSPKVDQGGGGAFSLLSMSEAEMRTKFEIKYHGQVTLSGTEVWHIQLDPRVRQNFKFAEMWVDKDGMPIQVRVTAHNNDTDTFKFSNVKRNNRISGSTFSLDVAKDTNVIKQ